MFPGFLYHFWLVQHVQLMEFDLTIATYCDPKLRGVGDVLDKDREQHTAGRDISCSHRCLMMFDFRPISFLASRWCVALTAWCLNWQLGSTIRWCGWTSQCLTQVVIFSGDLRKGPECLSGLSLWTHIPLKFQPSIGGAERMAREILWDLGVATCACFALVPPKWSLEVWKNTLKMGAAHCRCREHTFLRPWKTGSRGQLPISEGSRCSVFTSWKSPHEVVE